MKKITSSRQSCNKSCPKCMVGNVVKRLNSPERGAKQL